MYYIYRALNLISKKSYIGLTTRTINERWKEHVKYALKDCGCDYNTVLSKAIRKYPINTWFVYQLDSAEDIEHLKELEIKYIKEYHTFIKDPLCNGYNSTEGGDNSPNVVLFIPLTSIEILTGKIVSRFDNIKQANKKYKSRIDNVTKQGIAFPSSNQNICIVPTSAINNMDKKSLIKYINNHCPYIVCQLNYNGKLINRFISSKEASNKTNISVANIINCCLENRRQAGSYQWCYQKDLDKRINKKLKELKLGKPIVQYGMDGHKIKVWKNTEEAARFYGIDGSHITSCCKGSRQSCLKFQWRFLSDNINQLQPINQKRRVKCVETGEIFETRNDAAKYFNVSFNVVNRSLKGKKISLPYSFTYE